MAAEQVRQAIPKAGSIMKVIPSAHMTIPFSLVGGRLCEVARDS